MTDMEELAEAISGITNPSHSQFGSDLLKLAAENARVLYGVQPTLRTVADPAQKGEIVTALLINLAASALWDLVKIAAQRLSDHPGRDPMIQLNINGSEVHLVDIEQDRTEARRS